MPNGSDIIIRGGSVELEYDSNVYKGAGRIHKNPDEKLTRIEVRDDKGVIKYNSAPENTNKWVVRVICEK